MQSDKTVSIRKPYEKPLVHVIELKADEVLAVGCKTNRTTTKGVGNIGIFATCVVLRTCYNAGS